MLPYYIACLLLGFLLGAYLRLRKKYRSEVIQHLYTQNDNTALKIDCRLLKEKVGNLEQLVNKLSFENGKLHNDRNVAALKENILASQAVEIENLQRELKALKIRNNG